MFDEIVTLFKRDKKEKKMYSPHRIKEMIQNIIEGIYPKDIKFILDELIEEQPKSRLLHLDLKERYKYYIIGDLHADLVSLKKILHKIDFVNNYENIILIFLGDYIDRGKDTFELIDTILKLKSIIPDHIILLKGNHELSNKDEDGCNVSPMRGADNLGNRYLFNVLKYYIKNDQKQSEEASLLSKRYKIFFDNLAVALLCKKEDFTFLAVHGGLPRANLQMRDYYPEYETLESLMEDKDVLKKEQWYNMLWSDPHEQTKESEYFSNTSQTRFKFNKDQFIRFCKVFDIDMIFRAHEIKKDGYKTYYNDRLVSVFSTGGRNKNDDKIVNTHSYCPKVSPNIIEINLKDEIINSLNINFNNLEFLDDDCEWSTDFDSIKKQRNLDEKGIEVKQSSIKLLDDNSKALPSKSIKLYDNNNIDTKKQHQIIIKEDIKNYELTYAQLENFYGIPYDFKLTFNLQNNTINIQSKILDIDKNVLLGADTIVLKNGLSISLEYN